MKTQPLSHFPHCVCPCSIMQREGGGNNLYGDELRERLAERRALAAYILMQRIQPPINRCQPRRPP